jgi:signal transduction histidine kinase/CheY-like chemotaxis protein
VRTVEKLSERSVEKLATLAHNCGVVFERQRLSGTLQHFIDRLEVLNELNQLIASNVGLQRIMKSVARESAFRFAADFAVCFILDDERKNLEAKGGYGCAPSSLPSQISIEGGILGQVMRAGGQLSVTNLVSYPDHRLPFLDPLGVQSVDAYCLEVRGEALGALLIGYRRENTMSQNDLTRFEEFCQGAGVAIANARAQERLTSYTNRLEELVTQRTQDLEVQTERAEEANHAKSQFLANMSHELRTPLTAIVGYSSVLADGIFGALSDKQRDALNAIARSSDHLKALIDDVLNLARIESGKEEAEPSRVLTKDVLHQTYKLMMQTAMGKGVQLQPLQIADAVAASHMWVDPKHMHQIVINLLGNAVKYTPKGGKVWFSAEVVGDKVKIAINDTGVGISEEKRNKLFERFERGEDAYSKAQEGTGIGLNLTKRLVELNGGRIGVDSVEGKGSSFWIMMPAANAETAPVASLDQNDVRLRLDGLSALVVDDNRDTCDVLKHILIAAGATPRVTHSVREAIVALSEEIPDIVLTDLAMPGESGLELIKHISNSSGQLANVPVIVLSACAFDSDRESALRAGAVAFVPKPFRPTEIVRAVRQTTLAHAMGSAPTAVR